MSIKNLSKLPKRKVTIDELLSLDTIVDIAGDIIDDKNDIEELLVIYTHWDDDSVFYSVNGVSKSRMSWLMECVKHGLMKDR